MPDQNSAPAPDDIPDIDAQVDGAVAELQKLDGYKRAILAELGEKADGAHIVIAHQVGDEIRKTRVDSEE
ncbi:hypothetical protein ACH4S8_37285 [Streptomyces sp. NPDC021080]|uniref:hypothetical protein n=1 Tax=Streptomyces sp. NPDC021080 TaxID=3365110 RepID=UPI0037A65540